MNDGKSKRPSIYLRAAIERCLALPTYRQRFRASGFIAKVLLRNLWFYLQCLPVVPNILRARWNVAGHLSILRKNVCYGMDSKRQRVDIYFPKEMAINSEKMFRTDTNNLSAMKRSFCTSPSCNDAPVVIYAYGNAWSSGSPWIYGPIGRILAEKCGAIVLVPDYRTYPAGLILDQVSDLRSVVSFARRHFPQRKIVCLAHSSGAHTAALAAITADSKSQHGSAVPDVLIGLAGPYHLGEHVKHEDYRGIAVVSPMCHNVGGLENLAKFSPTVHVECEASSYRTQRFITSKLELEGDYVAQQIQPISNAVSNSGTKAARKIPEMYLLCSGADETVPFYSTVRFANSLRSRGAHCRLLIYEGVRHSDFVLDWMREDFKDKCSDFLGSIFPESEEYARQRAYPRGFDGFSPHVRDVLKIVQALKPSCS